VTAPINEQTDGDRTKELTNLTTVT